MDEMMKRRLIGAIVVVVIAIVVLPMFLGGKHTQRVAGRQASSGGEQHVNSVTIPLSNSSAGTQEDAAAPAKSSRTASSGGASVSDRRHSPVEGAPSHEKLKAVPGKGGAVSQKVSGHPLTGRAPQSSAKANRERSAKATKKIAAPASAASIHQSSKSRATASSSPSAPAKASDATGHQPTKHSAKAASKAKVVAKESPRRHRLSMQTAAHSRERRKTSASQGKVSHGKSSSRHSTFLTPGKWAVQVGAFIDPKRAGKLEQRLKAQGFHTYISSAKVHGHLFHQVRVGPVSSREVAAKLQKHLKKVLGNDYRMVPEH